MRYHIKIDGWVKRSDEDEVEFDLRTSESDGVEDLTISWEEPSFSDPDVMTEVSITVDLMEIHNAIESLHTLNRQPASSRSTTTTVTTNERSPN
jgi:hypothetical protein